MNASSSDDDFVPPYIAFKTLTALTERMEREDPPARIDKSYLDNLSGGYRTQVLAALHSLGLVDEAGVLSDRLKELVAGDEVRRKQVVADMVRERYQPVLQLSRNATQQQMMEAFTELAPTVTGDTRRKAIAFFLNACQYAGITTSPHWKTPRVPPSGRSRKARGAAPADDVLDGEAAGEPVSTPAAPPAQNIRSVELRSGGTVTLSLSVDLFALTNDDRDFVLHLVDKLRSYEDQRALPAAKNSDDGSGVSVGVQT